MVTLFSVRVNISVNYSYPELSYFFDSAESNRSAEMGLLLFSIFVRVSAPHRFGTHVERFNVMSYYKVLLLTAMTLEIGVQCVMGS